MICPIGAFLHWRGTVWAPLWAVSVGGLRPNVLFMGLWVLKKYRRQEPPAFLIIPSPEHNPFFKTRLCEKKYARRSRGRFFFCKPPWGLGLDGKRIVQKFVFKKVGGNFYLR